MQLVWLGGGALLLGLLLLGDVVGTAIRSLWRRRRPDEGLRRREARWIVEIAEETGIDEGRVKAVLQGYRRRELGWQAGQAGLR